MLPAASMSNGALSVNRHHTLIVLAYWDVFLYTPCKDGGFIHRVSNMARGESSPEAAAAAAAAEEEKKKKGDDAAKGEKAAEGSAEKPDDELGKAFDASVEAGRKEGEDAKRAEEDAKRVEEEATRAQEAATRAEEAERVRVEAVAMAASMGPAPTKADKMPIHRSSWLRRELGSGTSTDVDVFAILGRKIANVGANVVFNPVIRAGAWLQNWGARNPFLKWMFKVKPTDNELADIVPPPGDVKKE